MDQEPEAATEGTASPEENTQQHDDLDPDNPEHQFLILERDFNKTLAALQENEESAAFMDEFSKLYQSLYSSMTKEQELSKSNEVLDTELTDVRKRLEVANSVMDMDKKTIEELRQQIHCAWKMADAAHLREQTAQEVIDNLRTQVEQLNSEIEFRNKMLMQDSDETEETSKRKDALERERDKLITEVNQLTYKLNNALLYQDELEKKSSEVNLKMGDIANQLEESLAEIERLKSIKDRNESELSEMKMKLEDRDVKISDLKQTVSYNMKDISNLEGNIKELKTSNEKLSKELEQGSSKYLRLQQDYQDSLFEYENIKTKLNQKTIDVKVLEDESNKLKTDIAKNSQIRDIFEKRIAKLNSEKDMMVLERTKLRQRVAVFEKEIHDCKKFADGEKRILEGVMREKELMNKAVVRAQAVSQDQLKLIKIQEQSKRKLEFELDNFFMESTRQKKKISSLEKERDRLAEEQLDLTSKIEYNMEEIRTKKAQIFDLKKSISEQENKIRQQQNLFEAVRSERNALQKSLQEASAENVEIKRKIKLAFHQTEQLKEDISQKEQLLIKEETILRKIIKEKENLKVEVNTGLDLIRTLKDDVKEMSEEAKRLHKQLLQNKRTIRQQGKDIELLINERDILGSQLVRRNDEIGLMHEKIKILQTTLARGEAQYDQRLGDIKLLKIEVKRLRQEKILLTKSVNNMVDLRQEVFHLERDLTRYRLKCRALEEELQNPLNIHRWRKLEGSDPEVFELLQKIQLLQKRLLHQSSEAVHRERQLKESRKLYANLKQVLSKQPGPEIHEELAKTQKALKHRGDKLKCLVSELNMSEVRTAEYKSDLQKVTDELRQLKEKYLAEKKAHRSLRLAYESSRELNQSRREADEVKFTGGGFRMSVSQISTK